jgi:hypothetical protein
MNSYQVHAEADRLARELGISHSEALSRIARRPRRRRSYGATQITVGDRAGFAAIEQPAKPFWWNSPDR